MSTGVAVAMVAVVVVAVGALALWQYQQAQAARRRETDPATLIGSGIGQLVSGIAGAVTASESD